MDVVAAVAVAAVLAAGPQDGSSESDLMELERLESVWNEAHEKGDAEALDRLWADDFTATVPGMASMAKADTLGIWRTGRMKFHTYQTRDLQIRVYGDAAVVRGRLLRKRVMGERTLEDDWLFTKVYTRQSGLWLVVAFHASEAPQ